MALHLCKPKTRPLFNPSLIHLFSTSQNDNNENNNINNDSSSSQQSSLSSFFRDVKSSLKKPFQLQQQQNATGSSSSRADPSKSASLSFEEVKKNLSELPPSCRADPSKSVSLSFEEVKKNVAELSPCHHPWDHKKFSKDLYFAELRENLKRLRPNSSVNSNVGADSLSSSAFKSSMKLKPQDGSTVIGGTQEFEERD